VPHHASNPVLFTDRVLANHRQLLPSELVKLTHRTRRMVLIRDLMERQAMQYQLVGNEPLGKGPLVVLLDKSGSMDGPRDIWATAMSLALMDEAQRTRRMFAMLAFDYRVKHEVVPSSSGYTEVARRTYLSPRMEERQRSQWMRKSVHPSREGWCATLSIGPQVTPMQPLLAASQSDRRGAWLRLFDSLSCPTKSSPSIK
jgi:hypothetical protein